MLLSDVITCPRCGPQFGLVLLADRVENRRVLDGWFGCANCRERFRVADGFGDLRFDDTAAAPESGTAGMDQAERIAALLGVTQGPALVLVAGAGAVHAAAIADLVSNLEVIAAWPPLEQESERDGVSRIAIGTTLPFRTGSLHGIALTDRAAEALIEEAARVVAPRARVVVASGAEPVARRLEQCGLRLVARDEHAIVAARAAL